MEGVAGTILQKGQIDGHGQRQGQEGVRLQRVEAVLVEGVKQRASGGVVQADAHRLRPDGDAFHTAAAAAEQQRVQMSVHVRGADAADIVCLAAANPADVPQENQAQHGHQENQRNQRRAHGCTSAACSSS